eukprot:TRINITY_DN4813_c0_g1_i1.p1 TRINITY_DN4813_c0_g1~~TRINITY_DN4813_c0_g1_i1.p1  ORF type:complete len:384 (+),score=81.56 TRINITY_DN4813_c0_g1_i1:134-1285(+)
MGCVLSRTLVVESDFFDDEDDGASLPYVAQDEASGEEDGTGGAQAALFGSARRVKGLCMCLAVVVNHRDVTPHRPHLDALTSVSTLEGRSYAEVWSHVRGASPPGAMLRLASDRRVDASALRYTLDSQMGGLVRVGLIVAVDSPKCVGAEAAADKLHDWLLSMRWDVDALTVLKQPTSKQLVGALKRLMGSGADAYWLSISAGVREEGGAAGVVTADGAVVPAAQLRAISRPPEGSSMNVFFDLVEAGDGAGEALVSAWPVSHEPVVPPHAVFPSEQASAEAFSQERISALEAQQADMHSALGQARRELEDATAELARLDALLAELRRRPRRRKAPPPPQPPPAAEHPRTPVSLSIRRSTHRIRPLLLHNAEGAEQQQQQLLQ